MYMYDNIIFERVIPLRKNYKFMEQFLPNFINYTVVYNKEPPKKSFLVIDSVP